MTSTKKMKVANLKIETTKQGTLMKIKHSQLFCSFLSLHQIDINTD